MKIAGREIGMAKREGAATGKSRTVWMCEGAANVRCWGVGDAAVRGPSTRPHEIAHSADARGRESVRLVTRD